MVSAYYAWYDVKKQILYELGGVLYAEVYVVCTQFCSVN